jgi:beta-lactamase superfamily II metal-dependent hydrolase
MFNAVTSRYEEQDIERLDTNLTGSITSIVGPAVTKACFPSKEV